MKKYSALDAARFAGVEDKFKEVLQNKSMDEELLKEFEEIGLNNDVDQKIQQIKNDFINSEFVDIRDI